MRWRPWRRLNTAEILRGPESASTSPHQNTAQHLRKIEQERAESTLVQEGPMICVSHSYHQDFVWNARCGIPHLPAAKSNARRQGTSLCSFRHTGHGPRKWTLLKCACQSASPFVSHCCPQAWVLFFVMVVLFLMSPPSLNCHQLGVHGSALQLTSRHLRRQRVPHLLKVPAWFGPFRRQRRQQGDVLNIEPRFFS